MAWREHRAWPWRHPLLVGAQSGPRPWVPRSSSHGRYQFVNRVALDLFYLLRTNSPEVVPQDPAGDLTPKLGSVIHGVAEVQARIDTGTRYVRNRLT